MASKARDYADLKQDLDNAAFTGLYNDLEGLPTIPTALSQLTNDTNFITASSAGLVSSVNGQTGTVTVAFDFNDLGDVDTSAAGTNKFLTKSGSTYLFTGLEYSDLSGTPTIPSAVSELTNDSNFATTSYVDTQVSNLVDSSPATLDTLNELAAALGDDPNFATTMTTSLGTKASQTDLDAVEADVSTLQSEMVTRTSFDTLMLSAVNGNTSAHQTNASDISTLQTDLNTAEGEIDTLQTDLNQLESDVGGFNSLTSGTLISHGSKITALEAKTSLTDFTNDISEVTSTVPTSGTGKPAGYVWYIV